MNDKIKKALIYTGTIGAVISAVAYVIVTYVIVVGFESAIDRDKQIMFAILGAFIGLMITWSLRAQGITFGRKEESSIEVMEEYRSLINKKKTIKQLKTIKWFILWSTIQDIITKGVSVGVSTWFVMYIFMDGNGDFSLFALTVANICMFTGFGLVALSKGYDKYMEEHIPVIKEIIKKLKNDQVGSVPLKGEKDGNL